VRWRSPPCTYLLPGGAQGTPHPGKAIRWFSPPIESSHGGQQGRGRRADARELDLEEAVRLTGYLRQFALEAHWNACQRFGTFCYDVRSIAVPYKKARGEEATHILLYHYGLLCGHLPATGTAKERLDAAQKMYEEIEACYAAKEFERTGVRYDFVCG
jgi:hypothetical protein